MIDGFDHVGTDHKCNVCQCDFTDDEGGVQGYLGILPVAFCPTCFAGLCDMVGQMNDREWEGLTDAEMLECLKAVDVATAVNLLMSQYEMPPTFKVYAEAIEAKLKEKNYENED
tara:strand:+ start:628 stop:969 length:342 start_codon:yes stop_codon:yes gene_type:complete